MKQYLNQVSGQAFFWFVMAIGLMFYAFSRLRGYHFYDERDKTLDGVVDWTPWELLGPIDNHDSAAHDVDALMAAAA